MSQVPALCDPIACEQVAVLAQQHQSPLGERLGSLMHYSHTASPSEHQVIISLKKVERTPKQLSNWKTGAPVPCDVLEHNSEATKFVCVAVL